MSRRTTEALRQEHRIIQKVVAALVVLADRLETGRPVKAETLDDAVDFMRMVYGGHEKKEELYLFPALQRKGVSVHSVPIRTLMEEHMKGKALVAKLEKAAPVWAEAPDSARSGLALALRGLAALYPLHIWQEDLLLFEQADRALSQEDDDELLARFNAVDETMGAEVQQQFHELAERIHRESW